MEWPNRHGIHVADDDCNVVESAVVDRGVDDDDGGDDVGGDNRFW